MYFKVKLRVMLYNLIDLYRSLDMLFIACVRALASNIYLILDDFIMYYGLSKGVTVVLV